MSTTPDTTPDDVDGQSPLDGQDREDVRARRVAEAKRQREKRATVEVERDAAVAERDQLTERVEKLQRSEAERIAADVLADPEDLWLVGRSELGDLLDASGDLDPAAVTAAAQAVVDQRGFRFARPRNGAFDGGVRTPPPPPPPSLGSLLQDQARQRRGTNVLRIKAADDGSGS